MNTTPACLMTFLRGPGHGWYTAAARACFVGGAWALTSLSSNLGDLFATTSSDSAGLVEMWADAAALLLPPGSPSPPADTTCKAIRDPCILPNSRFSSSLSSFGKGSKIFKNIEYSKPTTYIKTAIFSFVFEIKNFYLKS